MIDENLGTIPIENGDKIIVELKAIDAQKAFNILGKLTLNKVDLKEYGLELNMFYPWEDKFKNNIKGDIRREIAKRFNDALNDIDKILGLK